MTLRELKPGQSARVVLVGGEGSLRQHFLDMGVIPGAELTLIQYAPMGDPMQLQIHGYELTLRLDDAAKIEVEPIQQRRRKPVPPPDFVEKTDHPGLGEGGKYHQKKGETPLPEGKVLTFALEMRRRVKEQLKKIGGMEFYDVNFSFVDNDSFEETFVSVPEQGGGKLIPDGMCNPGHIYTVSRGKSGMIGVYRLETQMLPGNGKLERTGLGTDREAKESTNTAFNYLKANANAISGNISTTSKDYIINYQDLNGIGITKHLALPTVIAICSVALSRPTVTGLAVLGDISISGTIMKVEDLANVLQVCLDSGAKKVLLPITSAADIGSVPSELVGAFSLIFYSTPQEAVFKALGVD